MSIKHVDVKRKLAAMTLAIVIALLAPAALLAHEPREVGELNFVVGFLAEPAFEGSVNGVSLRVTAKPERHSHEAESDMDAGAMDAMGEMEAMLSAEDVAMHGALFSPGAIEPGASFEVEITHEWEMLEIPFHKHPNESVGVMTVAEDADLSGTVEIEIHSESFSPSQPSVQPGSHVVFKNMSDITQNVFSGTPTGLPLGQAAGGAAADAGSSDEPVLGVEETLEVEVTHVSTGVSRTMSLTPVFGDPGHYVARFIPTSVGQYRFHYTGTIHDAAIDETFESGPGRFADIESTRELQFPVELPSLREVEGAVRGAQTDAIDADSSASTATTLAIFGLVAGILGLAVGGLAAAAALRRRAG